MKMRQRRYLPTRNTAKSLLPEALNHILQHIANAVNSQFSHIGPPLEHDPEDYCDDFFPPIPKDF